MNILVYFLFALSGFAGLIYEGSWARYLKLFLGHSSYGQVLTLCIYMGGLAIGSFVAGKLVERTKRPLLGYGIVSPTIRFTCGSRESSTTPHGRHRSQASRPKWQRYSLQQVPRSRSPLPSA